MPIIQVPVLVNTGEAQVLVCSTVPLPSPALEIVEIRKTVIIDSCTVIPNKVIIDGRLRKGSDDRSRLRAPATASGPGMPAPTRPAGAGPPA